MAELARPAEVGSLSCRKDIVGWFIKKIRVLQNISLVTEIFLDRTIETGMHGDYNRLRKVRASRLELRTWCNRILNKDVYVGKDSVLAEHIEKRLDNLIAEMAMIDFGRLSQKVELASEDHQEPNGFLLPDEIIVFYKKDYPAKIRFLFLGAIDVSPVYGRDSTTI